MDEKLQVDLQTVMDIITRKLNELIPMQTSERQFAFEILLEVNREIKQAVLDSLAAAPAPEPSVTTKERLLLRDLVVNDCKLVKVSLGYCVVKNGVEVGQVFTATVIGLIDKGLIDDSLTITELGRSAAQPPDAAGA